MAQLPNHGWVDTASRLIVQVGFPTVVAGVLLWFLLTRFESNMNILVERMSRNTDVTEGLTKAETSKFNELRRQTTQLIRQTAHLERLVEDSQKSLDIRRAELQALERQRYENKP